VPPTATCGVVGGASISERFSRSGGGGIDDDGGVAPPVPVSADAVAGTTSPARRAATATIGTSRRRSRSVLDLLRWAPDVFILDPFERAAGPHPSAVV
jgi:hypothetical protein